MSDETEQINGDDEAPGWIAIDNALEPIYGDQEPMHYGTIIKFMLGGPDPIDGVSVYRSDKGVPHWHYVTYGFTELYSKESEDPEFSGFGFELTMRLLRKPNEEPPQWPIGLMQNLARYVFSTGQVFAPGHYLDCNGPIALESDTQLKALIFAEDPELKPIDTPHGHVEFLQMFGVTLDELQATKRWNTLGFAKLIAEQNPFMIVDLQRSCSMENETISQKVEEGVVRDGSNTGSLFVTQLNYQMGMQGECELTFGAHAVSDIQSLIPARIGHGRELLLAAGECAIRLLLAEQFSCEQGEGILHINLTNADAIALANSLSAREGVYNIRKGLTVKVLKTQIKDAKGKVVQVIG